MQLIFILVAFGACIVGSICGIGGGVIIKPVLDAFGMYSVSTISFMSGCIVLSMTAYSVLKVQIAKESVIEKGTSTFLGLGAAIGGSVGKKLFDIVKNLFDAPNTVGAVQAIVLFAVTLATLIYTINKAKIKTQQVKNPALCALIGLALGMMSAFLGIGGGPINLVVLYYFFSMETKQAAQNSLYIILLSQLASLIFTIITRSVPEFPIVIFILMVLAGIGGAMAGRAINKKIDGNTVSKLFVALLCLIMAICCYNAIRFMMV